MKGLCIYVDGGKGHYVPAKAVEEELIKIGIETDFQEFFHLLNIVWLGAINKKVWRQMLKMPKVEKQFSRFSDAKSNGMKHAINFGKKHCTKTLVKYLKDNKIDFIFATHPYCSTVLSEMLEALNYKIPVYYFATDVFSAPRACICDKLRKLFISTTEGRDCVIKMGQEASSVEVVPFPLQQNIYYSDKLTKKEARLRLDLEPDLFTLQLNLGGEGLGTTTLIKRLVKYEKPMQIVVLGGMDKKMLKKFEILKNELPVNIKLYVRGFVNNVNEYLAASDIVAGRAGINTIVEAMYAHRPFLITELVYTVLESANYVEKYKVGWNCDLDVDKQEAVLKNLLQNPTIIIEIDERFGQIPIIYGPEKLVKLLIDDVNNYKTEKEI